MTHEQYSEIFNTNVDVGKAVHITRYYGFLMEDTAQETGKTFDDLSSDEKFK